MNITDLLEAHKERTTRKKPSHRFATAEYRTHYPLIRQAVGKGIPLMSVIKILREKEGAFTGKSDKAVHVAYSRAMVADGRND
jgi:hypothetical protein